MNGRRHAQRVTLPLLFALLPACAFLGWGEEEGPAPGAGGIDDNLSVVSAEGAFDPAAAVDDEDEDEPADRGPKGAAPPPSTQGAVDAQPTAEERIATPAEASATEEARDQAEQQANRSAEQGGQDDDEAKAELSTNPPPEELPEGEQLAWTAVDVLLEGALVAAAAAAVSALIVFAHGHRRTVGGIVAAGLAVAAFLWWQTG
jgi:hypothetical protein